MQTNKVLFKNDSWVEMKKGIDVGANAVAVTLGYGGRTVFISKKGFPTKATKDGVTVINAIRLADNAQDAGLKFLQDISTQTADEIGDSTTTVCVLTQEIITEGIKLKQSGVNVMQLKKGMEISNISIAETIRSLSKDIGSNKKLLKQVASVSANNDEEIGEIIGDVFDKIGQYGVLHIEDGKRHETQVELVDGFQLKGGLISHHFVNTKDNTGEIENAYILIIEGKIEKSSHIIPILEKVVAEERGIAIMAEDFDNDVLNTIFTNINGKAKLKATVIKHVFSGETKDELLEDICAITGAKVVSPKTGVRLENVDLSYLGQCDKIVSTQDETTIINGKKNKSLVYKRVADATIKIQKAKNPMLKQLHEYRLAKLTGGIAICYVGGATELEIGEKKDRIDDAVRATKCAIEEGVVIGGGAILIRCIENLSKIKCDTDDEKAGVRLIQKAIEKPLFQICENAGVNGSLFVEKVKEKKGNYGYNVKSGKIEDLFKSGIIDPAKVVRKCVENAISGAAQFLISECAIIEE